MRAVHNAAFGGGADVVEAQLVDDLRAGGDIIAALSIVAVVDGDVVGHVICSRASIADRPSIGLGPLGVIPACQRRGVGQALMHAVLAAADPAGDFPLRPGIRPLVVIATPATA